MLAASFFVVACGLKLGEDEAAEIISKFNGYPRPWTVMVSGAESPHTSEAIEQFFSEVPVDEQVGIIIQRTNLADGNVTLLAKILETVLLKIDEIIIDNANQEAAVIYSLHVRPVEPYFSMLCLDDKSCSHFNDKNTYFHHEEIKLKKDATGWQVHQEK